MEFSGQYLTYEEYRGLGGTIDLMPFNLLEIECRKKIDVRTQNRLVNLDKKDIPNEVKICEFKMIETSSRYDKKIEKINSDVIKSESIDGYSVTFTTDNEVKEILVNKEQEVKNIMEDMLMNVVVNGVHMMYLGASKC